MILLIGSMYCLLIIDSMYYVLVIYKGWGGNSNRQGLGLY